MKCQAWLILRQARRKGNGKPYIKIVQYFLNQFKDVAEQYLKEKDSLDTIELCGGHIIANIQAEDEPYYGGTYARLHIEFKCERCGSVFHEGLPDPLAGSEILNAWIQEILDKD